MTSDPSLIEIGDMITTTDGRYGMALEITANWVVTALERGGTEAIARADICEVTRKKTERELT